MLYWFIARPETRGAKCLIEHDGKILMIRNSYGRKYWTFPGGYVEKNESPKEGAIREAHEEVGIRVADATLLGSYASNREYKRDMVHCFYAKVTSPEYTIDPIEIAEAKWFPLDQLPERCGSSVPRIMEMYKSVVS